MPYDLVGDDGDYLGDELIGDDLVGASRRRGGGGGGGKKIIATGVSRWREFVLGFGSTSIAAGATSNITARPQIPFKGRRVMTSGAGLFLTDIKVGNKSQLPQAGNIMNEFFAATSVGTNLSLDTAMPAVDVIMSVNNPTGGAVVFNGAIWGLAAY